MWGQGQVFNPGLSNLRFLPYVSVCTYIQDTETTTTWEGGVEEVVALATEGELAVVAEWDVTEMDHLAGARQTSENLLTVAQSFLFLSTEH